MIRLTVFLNFLLVTTLVAAPKMAVIDMTEVLRKSDAGKEASRLLESSIKASEAELKQKITTLNEDRNNLSKQVAIISQEAFEEKASVIKRRERDLALKSRDIREDYERKNMRYTERIVTEINKIISQLVAAKKYDFVLDSNITMVVYNQSNLDITDEIVKKLNNVNISF